MQVVSSVQKYVSRAVLSALTSLLAKHPNPTVEELLSPFLKSPSVSECQQRLHVYSMYTDNTLYMIDYCFGVNYMCVYHCISWYI